MDKYVGNITTTENLDKIIIEVLAEDVSRAIREISASEIIAQVALGNRPTSLLVDNRGNRPITDANLRVQAFFADTTQIREAVYATYAKIQDLTRVASGAARGSYQIWFKEQNIGSQPGAIEPYLLKFDPTTDYFRIVGPVLVYGRKIYWNPLGKPKFTKIPGFRSKGLLVKLVRIRGLMNQVEQSMRRKYRSIAIAEDWVVTTALPKDGRTPAIWIGFKKKGALKSG